MSTEKLANLNMTDMLENSLKTSEDSMSLDGLEHIFQWAKVVVSSDDENRINHSQEKRIRRQVLELIQKYKDNEQTGLLKDEVQYLQRRAIALLTKINDLQQENLKLKVDNLEQYWALQQMEALKQENHELKLIELELAQVNEERAILMTSLIKHKKQINILENLVEATEEDNARLATMLACTRKELGDLKNRSFMQKFKDLFAKA